MKKINLLNIVTGLGVGGAEKVVLDLTTNANLLAYNVHVISLSKRIEMLNEFKKNNINIQILKKNNSVKDFIQIIYFLNKYVKDNKIEIIHAHMTHAMITAAIIKLMNPKIKLVFTSHSISFGSRLRKALIFLFKPFRNKDILFSHEQMSLIYKKDYEIIPNGVDVDAYRSNETKFDKFTFLSVGRLEHVKNHIKLLDCAIELKKKKYEFQILIAGEGDQRDKLEKYIEDNSLNENITLLGLRSDISKLMARSHVFVLSSLWEGMPIVLLEAGASGLPIISTAVGSIPSLVNEDNGYLVEEHEFCKTMKYVIDHYDEAKRKGIELQKKVIHNYSIKSIVKQHENLYRRLIKGKNRC